MAVERPAAAARVPLALFLLLLFLLPTAAPAFAPPYPIVNEGETGSLGLFVSWYEDRNGHLGIDDVTRLDESQFQLSEHDTLHFGYTRASLWLRVALQNTHDTDETLLLEVPHPGLSLVEFYRPAGDGWAVTRAGSGTRRVVGDFEHQHYLFGVTVPAGTTEVVWFHVRSDLALDFSLNLMWPDSFTHTQSVSQLGTGVMLGVLTGLVLFNLAALVITRRATYGWYLVSLVAIIVFLLANLGFIGVLFLRAPDVLTETVSVSALVATAAALQFARTLLDTRARQPQADMLMRALIAAGLLCIVAHLALDTASIGPMYTLYAAIAMVATVWAAWRAARLGCPDAPRYLVARLVSGTGGALVVASDTNLFPAPTASVVLLVSCASIEAVLTAWILYSRSRRLERETAVRERDEAVRAAEVRARGDFLGRLSHDIRTPLNGILGMAELLDDTTLTPRQRDYVKTIRTGSDTLLMLLNDALDWARLETGRLEVQQVDFELPQLVADSLEPVQQRAEEQGIELVVEIDPALPLRVIGDPARVRQVLCNLLTNAVRHTHRGEVHVHARPGERPGLVRFEVRDTGVGIPRERLASLLGDRARDGDDGARGFGLVVARGLVARMNGTLGAESEEHRGSVFWFSVPLPAAADQATGADIAALSGRKLLVVDDNAAVRRVIEQQATSWGMDVATADNGQSALAMARTQANLGAPFDAVIVDHNMPGMSGLQLAARIKEDPLIRHDALILMLTGLNIAPTETMARNVGIRRVLTKPVSGRALQATLAEELTRRERFSRRRDEADDNGGLAQLRVLVVEDQHLSQKVIRGMLNKLGVRSDIVSNGQEAVDAVQHNRYDLVLMDCEMPVLDGFEATRRIRAWELDNARRRTPIMALSAHILSEVKQRCRDAGMDGHVAKPIDLSELRDVLRTYAQTPR